MATESTGFVDALRNSLTDSAPVGAAAFVVNYVLAYVFVTVDGVSSTAIADWKIAGWLLYNAHNVDVELAAGPVSQSFNYLEQEGTVITSTVPKLAYYLVPVVVLVAAGYVAYQRTGGARDESAAVGVGASVVGSYVLLAAAGVFVFSARTAQASVAPKLTTAVGFAGVVYPVVFGVVGAVIGHETG